MMLAHGFEYVLLALDTACVAATDNLRTMPVEVFRRSLFELLFELSVSWITPS